MSYRTGGEFHQSAILTRPPTARFDHYVQLAQSGGLPFCPSVTVIGGVVVVVVVVPLIAAGTVVIFVVVTVLTIRQEMGLCDPYDRKLRHQNRNRIHLVEITTFLIMDENITYGRTHGRAEGKSDLRSMKLHLNPFYEVIHQKISILAV